MGDSESFAKFNESSSNQMVEFSVRLAWIAIMRHTSLIDCDDVNEM